MKKIVTFRNIKEKSCKDVVIIDLYSCNSELNKNLILKKKKLKLIIDNLNDTGSLWVICKNYITDNGIMPNCFEIAAYISQSGLTLRNIIIWFLPINISSSYHRLTNRYSYIFFFVKNVNKYFFNKDAIREKHIWKDVEWGKRADRYNSLGKDPGNVWLKTNDDGKGKITQHLPLSYEDVLNRIKLVACPKEGEIAIYSKKIIEFKNLLISPIYPLMDKRCSNSVSEPKPLTSNQKCIKPFKKLVFKVFNKTSENLNILNNNKVDLIVTSPPYWDMKNYKIKDQIGYSESYENYLSRIKKVWEECYRVLSDKGTFWLNINTKTHNKEIRMINYDFYKQCKEIGFKLWDIVIWHKSVSGPAKNNNLADKFEYILVFYKKPGFYFNKNYEFTNCDYRISSLKNMGNVWNINRYWGSIGKNYPHPAMYPDELIERILRFSTVKGDLVFDPFLGSGTTLIVAKKLSRACIGFEINLDYFSILKSRLKEENLENLFTQNERVEFL